jgi:hypothetical protein
MRPKYGVPRWKSGSRRRTRTSIGAEILLVAISLVATVIGIGGIYPQVIDPHWMQDAVGAHLPRMTSSTSDTTLNRSGIVAAMASTPRGAANTGQASVSAAAKAPELSPTVAALEPSAETATSAAPTLKPDAEAKADPDPAAPAAAKSGSKSTEKRVAKKRVVRVEHHRRGHSSYVQYGAGWGGWPGSSSGL